jgi:hypothetical protein
LRLKTPSAFFRALPTNVPVSSATSGATTARAEMISICEAAAESAEEATRRTKSTLLRVTRG